MKLLRVISQDPYIFEVETSGNRYRLSAEWYEENDECRDRIDTAIRRFGDARSFSYWLAWFELRTVAVIQSGGSNDELIDRNSLLRMLGVKSNTLSTRMKKAGFPKPVKISGRKQWWDPSEVDAWIQSQTKNS
jgi:predicted DNA-binding transcriptional regulator AlpA